MFRGVLFKKNVTQYGCRLDLEKHAVDISCKIDYERIFPNFFIDQKENSFFESLSLQGK